VQINNIQNYAQSLYINNNDKYIDEEGYTLISKDPNRKRFREEEVDLWSDLYNLGDSETESEIDENKLDTHVGEQGTLAEPKLAFGKGTLNVDTLAEPKLVFGKGTLNVDHVSGQGHVGQGTLRIHITFEYMQLLPFF
jgi:hypothetical protein